MLRWGDVVCIFRVILMLIVCFDAVEILSCCPVELTLSFHFDSTQYSQFWYEEETALMPATRRHILADDAWTASSFGVWLRARGDPADGEWIASDLDWW